MSTFLPPRVYPLTIAPGSGRDIDGPGVFCRIQSASGALTIGFDLGVQFATTAGKAYQCLPGENFNRVRIENPSEASALTVLVLVGRIIEWDDTLQIIGDKVPLALDGTDGTGIVPPAGAAGIRGWLSAIAEAMQPTRNIEWTPVQGFKPVAAAGVAERLADVDTFVDSVDIRALSTNTGAVKVGFLTGAGNQLWELLPSEWKGWKAPNGKRINLKNIWVDAAVNGEGIDYEAHS